MVRDTPYWHTNVVVAAVVVEAVAEVEVVGYLEGSYHFEEGIAVVVVDTAVEAASFVVVEVFASVGVELARGQTENCPWRLVWHLES